MISKLILDGNGVRGKCDGIKGDGENRWGRR